MNYLLDDDIDFGQYLDLTAHDVAVRPASFYIDDVVAHFHDYSAPLGAKTPWQKVGALVRFRSSEVTVWTGYNGHGKSLALGMVALGFVAQGQNLHRQHGNAAKSHTCKDGAAGIRYIKTRRGRHPRFV